MISKGKTERRFVLADERGEIRSEESGRL